MKDPPLHRCCTHGLRSAAENEAGVGTLGGVAAGRPRAASVELSKDSPQSGEGAAAIRSGVRG